MAVCFPDCFTAHLITKLLCGGDEEKEAKIQWFHDAFLPTPRNLSSFISFSLFLKTPVLSFFSITVFSLLASGFCSHYLASASSQSTEGSRFFEGVYACNSACC